jgi:hypothetical protein
MGRENMLIQYVPESQSVIMLTRESQFQRAD